VGRGAERSGGLTPRQRQVEHVLATRRRQVERVLAEEAFRELASVAPGEPADVKVFGVDVVRIPGSLPLLGYRIGSPALPTSSIFIEGGAVTVPTLYGKLLELYDAARQTGQRAASPDAPEAFLATVPTLRLLDRLLADENGRFGPSGRDGFGRPPALVD
jgi:hypothetical protein